MIAGADLGIPLISYPNSGELARRGSDLARRADDQRRPGDQLGRTGAQLVGGCCRVGPELITTTGLGMAG